MGKSKKRILTRSNNKGNNIIKRTEIIQEILISLKKKNIDKNIKNFITLFGISAEELSEAGASLEEISTIKQFIN